jgi:hypothetical protein
MAAAKTAKKAAKKTAKKSNRRADGKHKGVSITLAFKLEYKDGIDHLPMVRNINDLIAFGIIGSDKDGNTIGLISDDEDVTILPGARLSMTVIR